MYNFDFPLSPKARTFLKFENIFKRAEECRDLNSIPQVMYLIRAIIDFIDLVDGSSSIKIDLLKELERCDSKLMQWQKLPECNTEAVINLRNQIHTARIELDKFTRQRTVLKDDPLLENIKPRFFSPSGINPFDTPLFEFWIKQKAEDKLHTIQKWLYELDCLRIPTLTVLYLWRICAEFQDRTAKSGFLQENADSCDLISIQYADDIKGYPVVSGFQSRINIRFLPYNKGAPVGDIDFKIAYVKSTLQ